MKIATYILFLSCLLIVFTPVRAIQIQPINTSVDQYKTITDTVFDNCVYFSVSGLQYLFNDSGAVIPHAQKFIINDNTNRKWYFTVDNPYISIGKYQTVLNLTYPVRKSANDIFIPLHTFIPIYNQLFPDQLEYAPDSNRLKHYLQNGNILNIVKTDLQNGCLIDIQVKEALKHKILWVPPHYIININKGILSPEIVKSKQEKGLVKSILTVQEKNHAQITLYIPNEVDTIETNYIAAEKKFSVSIRKPLQKKQKKAEVKIKKPAYNKRTIIIDPGHGGKDPGAVFKGNFEKDIVLKTGTKLKRILTKKGFNVLLTREKDVYIPLSERPDFAAKHGGDLFISLHCNAIEGSKKRLKEINGYVAYILRAGESEEDKMLARRENKALNKTKKQKNKTEISAVEWILLEHELNLYSHQSERFAEKIVDSFKKSEMRKHRTGAHQAGFFVLMGTFMPAVLFEMGFITNEKDRKFIVSSKGQNEIAEKLAGAIINFFKSQQN
ncbi:MAG: N-acetylmuramoyl-L-alanine amidase [Fibrobacteria bacterium]|nr:N-acetylmuramoyl-L-alanine amidase [Fibrobacteria bacterium]